MRTDQDDRSHRTVGCLGLIAIPIQTVLLGVPLLIRGRVPPARGPLPTAPPELRPLTRSGNRILGGVLLFWTAFLPAGLAAAVIRSYHDNPAGLIFGGALVWVAMFVGHLIAMFIWRRIDPLLPKL